MEVRRASGLELGFNYGVKGPNDIYNVGLKTFTNPIPQPGQQNPIVASTVSLAYTLMGGS